MKYKKVLFSLVLASAFTAVSVAPVMATSEPSFEWISKVPKKRNDCYLGLGYCLKLKVSKQYVDECLNGSGDALHVEVQYFDKRGRYLGVGIDSHRQGNSSNFYMYPSANVSVFDSIPRPLKFSSVSKVRFSCLVY